MFLYHFHSFNYFYNFIELLQENSRLSTEKQSVQKSLSQERQSFRDRFHQMEMELEGIRAEKEEIIEKKCKEIRDLKAEMEAMEKQLLSNKKFIDVCVSLKFYYYFILVFEFEEY